MYNAHDNNKKLDFKSVVHSNINRKTWVLKKGRGYIRSLKNPTDVRSDRHIYLPALAIL